VSPSSSLVSFVPPQPRSISTLGGFILGRNFRAHYQINSFLQQDTSIDSDSLVRTQSILIASASVTLLVAFVAVLAKKWVLHYAWITSTSSYFGVVGRGMTRQTAFMGLRKWRLHKIIGFLPGMLQISLYLFGTAVFFYFLDMEVPAQGSVAAVTIFGAFFYICTKIVAICWRDSPFRRSLSPLPPRVPFFSKESMLLARVSLRRWWKRLIGTTTPNPTGEGKATNDYPMTLSNPAFWRDRPLFTSPIPKDITASAGFWLLENSTDFSTAAASPPYSPRSSGHLTIAP
jgi:hypothetical protein